MSDHADAMAHWAKVAATASAKGRCVITSVDSTYFGWADRGVHLGVIETWARRYGGVDEVSVESGLVRNGAAAEWSLVGVEDQLRGPQSLRLVVRDVQLAEVISDRLRELGLLHCWRKT